jgi:hypothetical protein
MKNRRKSVIEFATKPPMNEYQSCTRGVRDYLKQVPCIRREKISDIQRRLAAGAWSPGSDQIADRILFEHLLGPLQT